MQQFTIIDFHRQFPDELACLRYLFLSRYLGAACRKCSKTTFYKHPKRPCFTCGCGATHIFPKQGTIFEDSTTNLVKWFFAIFLMSQSRNGVAAKEIERHTGVTYKTAWRMQRLIRRLMYEPPELLMGTVEADETFIGGRAKMKERNKNKTIVFGALRRGGRIQTSIIPDTQDQTLLLKLRSNVAKGARLMTDEWKAYRSAAILHDLEHHTVVHSSKEFARGDVHTNSLEGFWSLAKRSLDGTHHTVSAKYLPLYLAEFQWRYNHRESERHHFELLLERCVRSSRP